VVARTEPAVGVLVVDDQPPFRRAARAVLGRMDGFEVVGEARTGEEAVSLADSLAPSLVLMDINLPDIDGIEATRRITRTHPSTVVVLVSTYRADNLPDDAASCGAAAYLHKTDVRPSVLTELWRSRGGPAAVASEDARTHTDGR
jgi:two-component system, NarL family, invasion response regulator UvrY